MAHQFLLLYPELCRLSLFLQGQSAYHLSSVHLSQLPATNTSIQMMHYLILDVDLFYTDRYQKTYKRNVSFMNY
jgi:hypothetical protein